MEEIKMEMEEVLYYRVDYYEWERVVNEFYKPTPKWRFVLDHEANNDSYYAFNIIGKVNDYDKKELEEFKEDSGNKNWMTNILLNDLCRLGLIPKGNYLIEVCW